MLFISNRNIGIQLLFSKCLTSFKHLDIYNSYSLFVCVSFSFLASLFLIYEFDCTSGIFCLSFTGYVMHMKALNNCILFSQDSFFIYQCLIDLHDIYVCDAICPVALLFNVPISSPFMHEKEIYIE